MATMIINTVVDQYGRPVASALVTIRDATSALVTLPGSSNPVITDSTGYWQASLEPGIYSIVISKGSSFISRTEEVCVGLGFQSPLFRVGSRFISCITDQPFRIVTRFVNSI